ncbi:adenylate/guanylate cyclase domain-containing protein [Solirubrobacter phytolaccae]|uniref:Adenylate/guanylate cyclase domain-containing protein n=1 Tax=Solirubrobacter phytolaccae TaxID=1404360 RepID=A0A9X3N644_9ACTN|nr:adenylate/guanylate cyclase domain-containing protein [Solirubrobacter phytolaccae]MDA0180463.1 adenylate/guanylate cyclase domain-containing protein [Solirubrobacter phytolaccae]
MTTRSPRRRLLLLLAAALLAVVVGAFFQLTGALGGVERAGYDARFDVRGDRDAPDDVVVIGIDERTVQGDDWPIGRDRYAKAIEELSRAGAGVIVMDVQITEASDDPEADSALISAVKAAGRPVVMATTETDGNGKTAIFGGGKELIDSRAIPASSLMQPDDDGVFRKITAEVGKLQTVMVAAASRKLGRPIVVPGGEDGALVDFSGPQDTFDHVSLAAVEAGAFDPAAVRGKVAVIGVTDTFANTLGDVHATPVDEALPGAEIQAATITTALTGFPLRDAPVWTVWLAIVLLAVAAPLTAARWGPFFGVVAGLLALALYAVVAQIAFNRGDVLLLVPPGAAGITAMAATAALVQGTRPVWVDRFLDRVSPSRGGNRRTHRLRALLLLSAAFLTVTIPLLMEATGVLKRLELSTVDTRFSVRGTTGPPPDVVLVGFDDVTFNDLQEQWPLDRKHHAEAITQLKQAGAKVIAYDVQFTEPSDNEESDDKLYLAVQEAGNVVLSTTEVGVGGTTSIFGGGEALKESRATPGSTNYAADADGRLRRMAYTLDGLETFPLAAVRRATGRAPVLPPGDSAWVNFPGGTDTVRQLSFSDVLAGRFPASAVRGKIVVVGSTATSLQDFHRTATSGDALMPGAELQADSIQTVLDGFPLRPAPTWLNVLFVIVLGALAPLAALRLRVSLAVGAGLLALAAFVVAAQVAFENGTIYTVVYPILAAGAGLLATGAIHGVTVAFEREQARDAFARFVPEAVVDQVLADADGVRLGGVRGEATVMFSDLRGFTSFSETLEPERVIESLNKYLTEMSEAILDHGGTLVAYMGDGIMAVFGAPLKQEDHADRALEAARDMLGRMDGFNGWLREQGLHDGFKMGIGLNSGAVMSGNVGSERRLEYTALGDTTNTAARLEGMTKGTPHQLYISDTTKQALTRPVDDIVEVGEAEVRGRKAKVKLWSLRDGDAPAPLTEPSQRVEA